ncbi:MAG TPA: type II secretion system F family protein [Clostridia bacterium]|nr:type II secretion system F family protein [Clostridia bacterium]
MSIDIWIVILSGCFLAAAAAALYAVYMERGGRIPSVFCRRHRDQPAAKPASPVDYDTYRMPVREKLSCILAADIAILTIGYIFYRSIPLSLFFMPLAVFYPGFRTKEIIRKRKDELNLQFREALYSIATSLSAGKSIETAFRDSQKELSIQYPDPETYILAELRLINQRIEMNETVEEAVAEFAARSHLEDIVNFTEVFSICKRTGGNLVHVVRNTVEIISEKIDVKQEINVLLTEKRLEYKVLNLIPVFIVLMLSTSAEEFMAPVFTEPLGRAAMTLALMLFAAACIISRKIMDIEV